MTGETAGCVPVPVTGRPGWRDLGEPAMTEAAKAALVEEVAAVRREYAVGEDR